MTARFFDVRHFAGGCWGLVAIGVVTGLTLLIADRASILMRSTIHLALVEYSLALWLMMEMRLDDWRAGTSRGRVVRWLWTWAWITLLLHVACAFHFRHGWSHADAFEQTRRESGFGAGLYVNYLLMTVWGMDVLWWWWSADSYAGRPAWIDRALHAFLVFIAFNATVVFEDGPVRLAGTTGAIALAVRWLRRPAAAGH